jgi:hypothetical protein
MERRRVIPCHPRRLAILFDLGLDLSRALETVAPTGIVKELTTPAGAVLSHLVEESR